MVQGVGKNVIARPIYEEASKIILSASEPKILHYQVLSVGKLVKEIKVDDRILCKYRSLEIDHKGEKLSVIEEDSVYAKL